MSTIRGEVHPAEIIVAALFSFVCGIVGVEIGVTASHGFRGMFTGVRGGHLVIVLIVLLFVPWALWRNRRNT